MAATLKLYDIVFDHNADDRAFYRSPNPWKIRLSLLHKRIPFQTVEMTLLEVSTDLTAKKGSKATAPALELEDGTLICDSYRIAEYLEENYPNAPSLFTGTSTIPADPAAVTLGKAYGRLVDCGLGNSDPQWAVWFDLIFPDLQAAASEGSANREYFISDSRLGPNGFQIQMDRPKKEDLLGRAKLTVLPLITVLRERPGEFFQGKEPGFVDYVIFGRYAMCRNNNPVICKQVWEDQGVEIEQWVERIIERFPEIKAHLRPLA
ncbi:glutathione S-transferase [Chytridium lagenaria]|nr:glutathione S-transferase [Chytridium lagenaria]